MKATYENNTDYSMIYINLKNEKECDKAMRISEILISYGDYGMSHWDEEVFILKNRDANKTISEMKDDYREAKKAV